MEFILQNSFFILLGLLIVGFAVFGVLFFGLKKKIEILFGGAKNKETDIQRNLVERVTKSEAKLEELEPRLAIVEAISKISVQKVGFLRFNPFHDTGGDNSFTIALLDRDNNGVVISSFYTREGVRVYAKDIAGGKSRYPLADEEKKVLEETMHKKFTQLPNSPNF